MKKRASAMSFRRVFLAVALNAVFFTGCSSTSDLGKECLLIRKDPADTNPADGIQSKPILESEIIPGKDFISFGATECEELVCVRDASTPPGNDPNAPAKGVCSRSCIETSASSCDDAVDGDKYVCRSMLLDRETLAAIKEEDPDEYRRVFGDNTSPFFCAKPLK